MPNFCPDWVAQFSSDPYPIIVYSCHLPTQPGDVVLADEENTISRVIDAFADLKATD